MKKILFLALGFAFFATSCSSKEKQLSSTDVDSTMIATDSVTPATMDSVAPMNVDSTVNMNSVKTDSAMVTPAK